MANNYSITHGSEGSEGGKTFASDQISNVDYQIHKYGFGALGSVTLVTSTTPLPVGGLIVPITATKTRTSDANAYAANDCVNNATSGAAVLTFTGAARASGGNGLIVGAIAAVNVAAEVEILELDLYTQAPAAIVSDNAELTILNTDFAKYLGTITFPALAKKTASSDQAIAQDLSLRISFSCSGSANLIAMIRTLSVFTPTSGAVYSFTLMCVQN